MERKIGEVFTCNGELYRVVRGFSCNGCAFMKDGSCYTVNELLGPCDYATRSDKTGIIFKEIKDMEIKNNQLTIDIPEGMEIDLENSDLAKGIIQFKKSNITYKDITDAIRPITYTSISVYSNYMNKLKAISQLMTIAKYYNEDWEPDWISPGQLKWYIYYSNNKYQIGTTSCCCNYGTIYFRFRDYVQAVINNPNFRDILDKIYKN